MGEESFELLQGGKRASEFLQKASVVEWLVSGVKGLGEVKKTVPHSKNVDLVWSSV